MTARTGKLEGVEASRGAAAILVVGLHVTNVVADQYGKPVFGGLMSFGHAGVDFFFVLSGFIITFIHRRDLGRPDQFWQFWRKRLWRIYPVYWFAAAGFMALLLYSPTRDGAERHPAHLIASFLLWPEEAVPILGVGWSLRHELLFYAVFGTLILHRRLGLALLLAWAAGIALNIATVLATGSPYFHGIWQEIVFRLLNAEFFFGMGVAVLVQRPAWRPLAVFGAGVALFLGTGLLESFGPALPSEWPVRHLGYAAGAAAALYGTACLDQGRGWAVPRWAVALGSASYSIYLVHVPVALVLAEAARRVRGTVAVPEELAFVLVAGGAIAGGLIVHRLVERPVMRYARTGSNRPVPRSPSGVVPAQTGLGE